GLTLQSYEERFLFLLLLLRKPRMRIIYVTSQPILPTVIDYYLGLLPGVIGSHARKRFFEVTPLDGSSRPLSQKLMERPRMLERPSLRQVLVKLNEGVSGEGNALVHLEDLPAPGSAEEPAAVAERLRAMSFELPTIHYQGYVAKLAKTGGIVEERITGEVFL